MSINASIPNYDSSKSNKPFYRRLFSKKQEITLTDAGLVSEKKRASGTDKSGASVSRKAFKVMGEVYSNPPKKGLFERNKIVINIKVDGKPLYAKVNKNAFEKQFDISTKEVGGQKTAEENTRLIKDQILHKRFEQASKAKDYQEMEDLANLGSLEAATEVVEKYFKDRGITLFLKGSVNTEGLEGKSFSTDIQSTELLSDEQGLKLLERVAILGNVKAMEMLGYFSEEDDKKLAWFEAAAFNGSQIGMENAAQLYANIGLSKDKQILNLESKQKALSKALFYLNASLENSRVGKALIFKKMGDIYSELGEVEEALKHYKNAAYDDKTYWVNVGDFLMKRAPPIAQDEQSRIERINALSEAQIAYGKANTPEGKVGFAKATLSLFPFLNDLDKIKSIKILKPMLRSIIPEYKDSDYKIASETAAEAKKLLDEVDLHDV